MAGYAAPTDYDAEARDIERRRKYAEALQAQSMQPLETQMAGGWAIPISPTQGLAKALQAYKAKEGMDKAKADQKALTQRVRSDFSNWATQMPQATEAPMVGSASDQAQFDMPPQMETRQPSKQQMLSWALQGASSGNPLAAQMATPIMTQALKQQEPYTLAPGAIRMGADNTPIASAPFRPLAPPAPPKTDQPGAMRQRISGEQLIEEELQPDGSWKQLGQGPRFARQVTPVVVNGGGKPRAPVGYRFSSDGETLEPIPGGPKDSSGKQLPTQALKLQQQELDAIGTMAGISSDLKSINDQIDEGKIVLGPVKNLVSQARSSVGMGNEQSRNYNSFVRTLEKMRNDSLRLNKGTQTEGDAIRAWNELMGSLNDKGTVQQRLREIAEINERAVNLRKMNVDSIRSNYGLEPLDVSGYSNQLPAVGKGASGNWDQTKEQRYQELLRKRQNAPQ